MISRSMFLTVIIMLALVQSAVGSDRDSLSPKTSEPISISLKKAWELTQEYFPNLREAKLQYQVDQSSFSRMQHNLSLPKLELQTKLDTGFTIAQIPGSADANLGSSNLKNGAPNLNVGLVLSEYNLYNSGLDLVQFKTLERQKELSLSTYKIAEGQIRQNLITAYFNFVLQTKIEDANKKYLAFLEAILDLLKIKKKLHKVTEDSVTRAEIDLSRAAQTLVAAQAVTSKAAADLNYFLNYEQSQQLNPSTDIPIIPVKIVPSQIEELLKQKNNNLKSSFENLEIAKMDLQRSQMEIMPIKISLSGAVWSSNIDKFTNTTTISTQTATAPGVTSYPSVTGANGNFDLNIGVTMSLPLIGEKGFLGSKERAEKLLKVMRAEENYKGIKKKEISDLKFLLSTLAETEGSIDLERQNFEKISSFLNAKLGEFPKDSTSLLEMRELLDSVKNQEIQYYTKTLERFTQVQNLYFQIDKDIMEEIQ